VIPLTATLHVATAASIVRLVTGGRPHIAALGGAADPFTGMNVPIASEGDCGVIVTLARVVISP